MPDYFIFIENRSHSTPFMDAIGADSLTEARRHARKLLAERPASHLANIFLGPECVEVIQQESAVPAAG